MVRPTPKNGLSYQRSVLASHAPWNWSSRPRSTRTPRKVSGVPRNCLPSPGGGEAAKKKAIRKKWKWEYRKGEKRGCVTSTQCRRRFKSQRLSYYHLVLYACLTLLSISIPRGRLNSRKVKQRGGRVVVRWGGGGDCCWPTITQRLSLARIDFCAGLFPSWFFR